MTASDLWAMAHGLRNQGSDACYWCGSACERLWFHGEEAPSPFSKNRTSAKRPGNKFVCSGCYLYRRKRVTVAFLTEGLRDGQTAAAHSWYLTEAGVWGLRDADHLPLYKKLLEPPHRFALALKTSDCPRTEVHLAIANDLTEIKASTPLHFTLNNQDLTYTIYELETALKQGSTGTLPGVQALLRFLGRPLVNSRKEDRGRPAHHDGKLTQRVVVPAGKQGMPRV